jgi:hypothetical protein
METSRDVIPTKGGERCRGVIAGKENVLSPLSALKSHSSSVQ